MYGEHETGVYCQERQPYYLVTFLLYSCLLLLTVICSF